MNDLPLSPVAAGLMRLPGWGLDARGLASWIAAALDLGITSFDHADIYGGYTVEAAFGDALAQAPDLRQRLTIVTKFGIKLVSPNRPSHRVKSYDSSVAHLRASVDASLAALRCGHIDLLLLHRPDWLMLPVELAAAVRELQAAGKVRHFGVSNHSAAQVAALRQQLPLAAHQFELSLMQRQALDDGTLLQCQAPDGPRAMAWSPLAGGRLLQGDGAGTRPLRDALAAMAPRYGVSPAALAQAWVARHPARPVIVSGSGRLDALREAVAATQLQLDAEDWYALWQAATGHEVP